VGIGDQLIIAINEGEIIEEAKKQFETREGPVVERKAREQKSPG
jgi:hypothetical protein